MLLRSSFLTIKRWICKRDTTTQIKIQINHEYQYIRGVIKMFLEWLYRIIIGKARVKFSIHLNWHKKTFWRQSINFITINWEFSCFFNMDLIYKHLLWKPKPLMSGLESFSAYIFKIIIVNKWQSTAVTDEYL